MGRRRWEKVGSSKTRKLVAVSEAPWSPVHSLRVNQDEEKILAKAEEIRLRQSGFVFKTKQQQDTVNAELLKGQIFFVDCQLDNSEQKNKLLSRAEITEGIVNQLHKLGATVSQSLTKKVNKIIFMNGRYTTYKFAQQHSVPLISSGWIEESKKLNKLAPTEKHMAVVPSNFLNPVAPRKYKRNYTLEHLEKLEEKKKSKESDKPKDEHKSKSAKLQKKSDKKLVEEVKSLRHKKDHKDRSKKLPKEEKKSEKPKVNSERSSKQSSTTPKIRQENSPPLAVKISPPKRRSQSVEVVKEAPTVATQFASPGKPASPTNQAVTPMKRIRIESSCSPMATPPRDLKPKTEIITVSNLTAEQFKTLTEAVAALGRFQVSRSAKEGVTHVVWGSGRTINLLRSIALGCRILTFDWVVQSKEKGSWLPEDEFVVPMYSEVDKEIQRKKKQLGQFFSCQLLRSVGPIYVNSGVTSSKPDDLRALIRMCGGTLVHNIQDAVLVVGPPPDKLVFSTTSFVKENWVYCCLCSYQIKPIQPFVYKPNSTHKDEPPKSLQ